jgi:acyl-coenzyme A synthetase/AMP-(fatty) acid ligase
VAIELLRTVFDECRQRDAIVAGGVAYSYAWLLEQLDSWRGTLPGQVPAGAVTVLEGDYSATSIALFLALLDHGCIVVPLTAATAARREEFFETAEAEYRYGVDGNDAVSFDRLASLAGHPYYAQLRAAGHPGLVVFSSGSTGPNKGIVHDAQRLLDKFQRRRQAFRSIAFLHYDHLGGINTMLHILSTGGCLITMRDRNPDTVAAAIERHRAELLPASPTFLNLLLLTRAYARYDLSSLQRITYGTEPMPESTLKRLREALPNVELQQTYGLSEVGALRTKSRTSESLWMRIGGEQFETRVVNGILQIRAQSAMLGYLNAPSAFTDDGWLDTGDCVEVDGEYIRILGRKSDVVNVGGEKVYPAEVEDVIQELENVAEATVFGEPNALMGQIVCARIRLCVPEDAKAFQRRLRQHCRARLQEAKVPVKIFITEDTQSGVRGKKVRTSAS